MLLVYLMPLFRVTYSIGETAIYLCSLRYEPTTAVNPKPLNALFGSVVGLISESLIPRQKIKGTNDQIWSLLQTYCTEIFLHTVQQKVKDVSEFWQEGCFTGMIV